MSVSSLKLGSLVEKTGRRLVLSLELSIYYWIIETALIPVGVFNIWFYPFLFLVVPLHLLYLPLTFSLTCCFDNETEIKNLSPFNINLDSKDMCVCAEYCSVWIQHADLGNVHMLAVRANIGMVKQTQLSFFSLRLFLKWSFVKTICLLTPYLSCRHSLKVECIGFSGICWCGFRWQPPEPPSSGGTSTHIAPGDKTFKKT